MFNIFLILIAAILIGGYVATYELENTVPEKTAKIVDVVYFSLYVRSSMEILGNCLT